MSEHDEITQSSIAIRMIYINRFSVRGPPINLRRRLGITTLQIFSYLSLHYMTHYIQWPSSGLLVAMRGLSTGKACFP